MPDDPVQHFDLRDLRNLPSRHHLPSRHQGMFLKEEALSTAGPPHFECGCDIVRLSQCRGFFLFSSLLSRRCLVHVCFVVLVGIFFDRLVPSFCFVLQLLSASCTPPKRLSVDAQSACVARCDVGLWWPLQSFGSRRGGTARGWRDKAKKEMDGVFALEFLDVVRAVPAAVPMANVGKSRDWPSGICFSR